MGALDLDALKRKVLGAVRRFSGPQLVIIGLLSVVALIGGIAFLRWVSTPTYDVLLSGLDARDAAEVTEKLKADGVPYHLEQGGGTILVPASSVDAERIAIAAAGLPKGSTSGYELLDKQGMTSSSFQQQVAYQRALEGELSKTLSTLDNVKSANVHLAVPEERLFADQQKPTRASVLLDTRGELADDTVTSVVHLVSSAVPGLEPSAVSVTDTAGRVLSDSAGSTAGSSKTLKLQQAQEDALSARATSMLDALMGPGKAVVRVSAEMDTANRTTDTETYDPSKTAVLRDNTSNEVYGSPGSGAAGGPVTITPPDGVAGTPGTPGTYNKNDSSKEFGVSRTVQREEQGPGGLKRLTVAVAVDANAANAPATEEVQSLVANAVGLDPARGDTIAVSRPSFIVEDDATRDEGEQAAGGLLAGLQGPLTTGGAVLVLLLVGIGFLRAVRRGSVTEIPVESLPGVAERPALVASPATPEELAAKELSALMAGGSTRELPSGGLMQLVDENPEEIATVLRGWLSEPGTSR